MNTKTTLTVLLLAIAIGVYFLVFETDLFNRKLSTTREAERRLAEQGPAVGEPLIESDRIDAERVQSIRIERPDRSAVVIERGPSEGRWIQAQPVRFPMRPTSIRELIRGALDLRYTRQVRAGQADLTLKEMGLDPARAVVALRGEGMEPIVLRLGRRAGVGRAYLMLGEPGESSAIYLVNDALHEMVLDAEPSRWRSSTLASIPPGSVQEVRLNREGGKTVALAQRDGRWVLVSPVTGRADRTAVNALIGVINGANIGRFVEDQPSDLKAYGLAEPSLVLNLDTAEPGEAKADGGSAAGNLSGEGEAADGKLREDEAAYTLRIGGPTDLEQTSYFAMYGDAPVVFTLPETSVAKLRQGVDELRDTSLTPVARSDVQEITIERSDAPSLHFVRDGGTWAFGKPDPGYELGGPAMDGLLNAIFDTRADAFANLSGENPASPVARLVMTSTARENPERLTVYERGGEQLMVVREGESTGHLVPREKLHPLFQPALAYRDRTVLALAADEIQRIDVIRSGRYPAEYHLKRTDAAASASRPDAGPGAAGAAGWELEGRESYNESAVRALVEHLTPLRAERWLADPPAAPPEGVEIRLSLAEGETRTLTIAPEAGTASVQGVEMPFQVSRSLVDAATAELRDTTVLALDPARITSVETGDLLVERDQNGRYSVSGGELSEQRAAALYNALAGLSAQHYVDADPPQGDPAATLTATTVDQETHTVRVWTPAEGPPIVRVGEQAFTIAEETARNLLMESVDDSADS